MEKTKIILSLVLCFVAWSCIVNQKKSSPYTELQNLPVPFFINDSMLIPGKPWEETGDPDAGYRYLTTGNSFSSGIPLPVYKLVKALGWDPLESTCRHASLSIL